MSIMQRLLNIVVLVIMLILARCQSEQQSYEMRQYIPEDGYYSDYIPMKVKEPNTKRKQFYAWAGKRSNSGVERRKQFYAWAGR
ncbi:hypothetical protein DICVIV_00905 [Dictyocaulus viviparus]|uniref:Uncharacterized protein n=1 Tax=Dictyocaulus viviparus TaxID=29172 RepID=A0A0D8Y814_DICVI|nr:hypothetical protein DICVIV_00905 [Dictyocaulus viviparus]